MAPDIRDAQFREDLLSEADRVADAAELFWVAREGTPVSFEANKLKQAEYRETSGVALRIIKDGRIGFSSTTNLGEWRSLIDSALEMAPFGAQARFQFPGKEAYEGVEIYDPSVDGISQDDLAGYGHSLIDGALSQWPDVLWDARISKSKATVGIMNSVGCRSEYAKSVFSMSLHGERIQGTDMLFVWDRRASCRVEDFVGEVLDTVLGQLDMARETVPAPEGDVPVLFTPEAAASSLLSPLLAGFSGKSILQGSSPLIGKLGEQVVDSRFSMRDHPFLPLAPGSRMCDDEGVPSQRLPLIQRGIVANFLYDLRTAAQADTTTTASAERSLASLPSPSATMLVVEEGDVPEGDIIRDIDEGLMVQGLLGSGQSNILGGDFKGNVLLGYKIEKGRIVGRVKNTMISGNAYRALSNLVAIGNKAKWVGGSLLTPTICCQGISVASST